MRYLLVSIFLEAGLAEAEHHVDHLLREGRHAVHHSNGLLLHRGELWVVGGEVDRESHFRPIVLAAAAAPLREQRSGKSEREAK